MGHYAHKSTDKQRKTGPKKVKGKTHSPMGRIYNPISKEEADKLRRSFGLPVESDNWPGV